MSMSIKTKLDDKITLELFLAAHRRASKSKGLRSEVLTFNRNKIGNLFKIMNAINNETYLPSNYRRFIVHDPKDRMVLALPYWDRVIHQWVIEEFIKPFYIPRFINDTFACIPGRGTHKAASRIEYYMRRMYKQYGSHYYIVKMDISKFFNSIDPHILFKILSKRIKDPKLLRLIYVIIFDGDDHDGIPIGNYVSQYFANIYLNELDQYCKNKLGLKYYVRYMDDFVALVPDKATARRVFAAINEFIVEKLNLKMNPKSRYYPASRGLDFVGYRMFGKYRLLRRRSKVKLRLLLRRFTDGRDDLDKFICRAYAWLGHARHANSYHYRHKYLGYLKCYFPRFNV